KSLILVIFLSSPCDVDLWSQGLTCVVELGLGVHSIVAVSLCIVRSSCRRSLATTISWRQLVLPITSLMTAMGMVFLQVPVLGQTEMSRISGSVTYEERLGLAKNSSIHIRLEDVTDPTAPPVVLAEKTVSSDHSQAPVSFSLSVPRSQVHKSHKYAVSAEV